MERSMSQRVELSDIAKAFKAYEDAIAEKATKDLLIKIEVLEDLLSVINKENLELRKEVLALKAELAIYTPIPWTNKT